MLCNRTVVFLRRGLCLFSWEFFSTKIPNISWNIKRCHPASSLLYIIWYHPAMTAVHYAFVDNKTTSTIVWLEPFAPVLMRFFSFAFQTEPTGPTPQPTARTPFWTPWWKVLTTILTLCPTWATTLIHCQTLATPRTWWTATSWPGLTPTCRIGKKDRKLFTVKAILM